MTWQRSRRRDDLVRLVRARHLHRRHGLHGPLRRRAHPTRACHRLAAPPCKPAPRAHPPGGRAGLTFGLPSSRARDTPVLSIFICECRKAQRDAIYPLHPEDSDELFVAMSVPVIIIDSDTRRNLQAQSGSMAEPLKSFRKTIRSTVRWTAGQRRPYRTWRRGSTRHASSRDDLIAEIEFLSTPAPSRAMRRSSWSTSLGHPRSRSKLGTTFMPPTWRNAGAPSTTGCWLAAGTILATTGQPTRPHRLLRDTRH